MYEQKTNQSNLLTVRLILGCALWSVKYGSVNRLKMLIKGQTKRRVKQGKVQCVLSEQKQYT